MIKTIKKDFYKSIIVFFLISAVSLTIVLSLFWTFLRRNIEFSVQHEFENILINFNHQIDEIAQYFYQQKALSKTIARHFEHSKRNITADFHANSRVYYNDIIGNFYGVSDRIDYFAIVHENGQVLFELDNMVETHYTKLANIFDSDFFKNIISKPSFLLRDPNSDQYSLYIIKKDFHKKQNLVLKHYLVYRYKALNIDGLTTAMEILLDEFSKKSPIFVLDHGGIELCIKFDKHFFYNAKACENIASDDYSSFIVRNSLTNLDFAMVMPKRALSMYLFKCLLLMTLIAIVPMIFLFLVFYDKFKIITEGFKKIKNQIIKLVNVSNYDKKIVLNDDFYYFDFKEVVGTFNHLTEALSKYHEKIKAQSKLAAIGQTTAILAHDVRKPFSNLKAMLDMIEYYKSHASALESAKEEVTKSISNVERMISDIIDFSREVKIFTKPSSIVPIVDFSIRQTAKSYHGVDISFRYNIENIYRPLVDDERIARSFSNIILNAIEAITILGQKDKGLITISTIDKRIGNKKYVEVVFRNNGPAIDKEDMPNLFESFFTKGKRRGTGLGLVSAHKIVTLHEGQITARNVGNNEGTEFIIEIPASEEVESHNVALLPNNMSEIVFSKPIKNEAEMDAVIKKLSGAGHSFKVVLLEDETLYRAAIRNLVKRNEELNKILTLYEAETVDDALDLVEKEGITHAIVDIVLDDEKDGYDFLRETRERNLNVSSLVHSNRLLDEYIEKAKKMGAKGVVSKPLRLLDLVYFLNQNGQNVFNKITCDKCSVTDTLTSNYGVLGTRFKEVPKNCVDYCEISTSKKPTYDEVMSSFKDTPIFRDSSLQLYIHIPFCIQNCVFCAFYETNTDDISFLDQYSKLLLWQLDDLIKKSPMRGNKIKSVHIGGGTPNILGHRIGHILDFIRKLDGCEHDTEISVEFNVASVDKEFLDKLIHYQVQKVSFGVQSFNPSIRKQMNLPDNIFYHMDRVLEICRRKIPIINVDLMTSFPGQTLEMVNEDISILSEKYPEINAISSYLLTLASNPNMLGKLFAGKFSPQASQEEQALMRLQTVNMLKKKGWVRKGTHTYVNPDKISKSYLDIISGSESIGQSNYESYLISVGPSAVGIAPGLRFENNNNVKEWCAIAEKGIHPFNLDKCSTEHQKDIAFWVFPLRYEGLLYTEYARLKNTGAISEEQTNKLEELVKEGFIYKDIDRFNITNLGEVFVGDLVRELKKDRNRMAVDKTIKRGFEAGKKISKKILEEHKKKYSEEGRKLKRGN